MNQEFERIAEEYGLSGTILQRIEERLINQAKGRRVRGDFLLTSLQREVFNDKRFWEGEKNIIIKGATSSGKTLVSEIAAVSCLAQRPRGQVIILVPLKAMVRERCKLFQEDLGGKRVFAASSDYQDHDNDLLQGDYDVAVIVYEKFFAMIAQRESRLLEKCGLLIVDEIQMLSSEGRGPKLEFSLQRILQWHRGIRIMGLTTTDAEVGYLQKWLGHAEVLGNDIRPVGLEEAVISTEGNIWKRIVRGEADCEETDTQQDKHSPLEERLELIEKLSSRAFRIEKKDNLLLSLLCRLLSEDENREGARKIIIFTNSRNQTRRIAKLICRSGLIQQRHVPDDLMKSMENVDNEDSQLELLGEILPYGVAFHNSALPVSLRQIIEDDFSDSNGTVNMIVATETLTIGMNMPTDVMILYDKTVYRGDHEERDLLTQEYKNFIGRAGRYGLASRRGQSFLIVSPEELDDCWHRYVYPKPTPISSSMLEYNQHGNAETVALIHAPYYLNLMPNQPISKGGTKISTDLLEQIERESFSNVCSEDKGGVKVTDMLRWLERAKVLKVDQDYFLGTPAAELQSFGQSMAPYALSCRTCFTIFTYLVHDGLEGAGNGGLPYSTTEQDIADDKYLLDILFQICLTAEVAESANLNAPDDSLGNTRPFRKTVNALLDYLKRHSREKTLWPNSALEDRFFGQDIPASEYINALMRAVVLLHWTRGETLREIKRNTGLDVPIVIGDIERVAEACSYQLDAVSKAINSANERREKDLRTEFYRLSTRVKYGMKRELVLIANRHIEHLDRNVILRLGRVYDKYKDRYENIVTFLKEALEQEMEGVITSTVRDQIIDMIDHRYLHDSRDILLDKMLEDGILGKEKGDTIRTFAEPGTREERMDVSDSFEKWTGAFEGIVQKILHLPLAEDREAGKGFYLVGGEKLKICFYLTMETGEMEAGTEEKCKAWYDECRESQQAKNLVIVGKVQPAVLDKNEVLILSASNFSGLALQYIAEIGSLKNCWGTELVNLFADLRGSLNGYGCGNLQSLVQNYAKKMLPSEADKMTDIIIIYDRSFIYSSYVDEVQNILIGYGLKVRKSQWMQYDVPQGFHGILLFFLGGNYILSSKSVLALSKQYRNSSCALWYLDEDRAASEDAGYRIKGLTCSDAGMAAEHVRTALESMRSAHRFAYDVGISYRHHDGDDRMRKLAELLADCYGEDRVLFDKFHPELFDSQGDAERVRRLFRDECCYVIVGVTNDYEESAWIYHESRGISSMASNTPKEQRVGYVVLEHIQNPDDMLILDFGQDGTYELFSGDEEEIKGAFHTFRKTIDETKRRLCEISTGDDEI